MKYSENFSRLFFTCFFLVFFSIASSGTTFAKSDSVPLTGHYDSSQKTVPENKLSKNSLRPIHTTELLNMLADAHGKVILVNFFAAFCGPCRKEIPELIKMNREISSKDLLIIGIAIDQNIREANDFVQKIGLLGTYPVFYGGERLAQDYRIDAIPFNVIYNKEGHIEASEAGYIPGPELKKFLLELIRR